MATKKRTLPEITPNALATCRRVSDEFILIYVGNVDRKNASGKVNTFMQFAVPDSLDPSSPAMLELMGSRALLPEDAEKTLPKGQPLRIKLAVSPGTNFGTFINVVGWAKL